MHTDTYGHTQRTHAHSVTHTKKLVHADMHIDTYGHTRRTHRHTLTHTKKLLAPMDATRIQAHTPTLACR